jgi:hypothetical protein
VGSTGATFGAAQTFPLGGQVDAFGIGNFDGDTLPDIAGANYSAGKVSTAVNTSDIVAPDTNITGGPTGATNTNTPSFTFTSTEGGSTFLCSVDGGTASSCTSPYTTPALTEGLHTVQVRAIDAAGNPDPVPATQNFTVDTVAPDTNITGGPTGPTNDNTPSFTFTSTEGGSTFQCKVDAGAFAACSTPFTTAALADGAHSVQVRAIDAAGNIDGVPATRSFTVDATPPDTSITGGPNGATNGSSPSFTFTSTEPGSTFECKTELTNFVTCTSPFIASSLADGAHTVSVRATDATGNVDAIPATRSFTVDTVAPDTNITGGPTGPTGNTTPAFTFTSTEGGSTFQCKLDAGAFAGCSSPFTTTALADGAHTVQVRAIDAAGNTDGAPASRAFTVDATPPDTTITGGPSGLTTVASPSFTFTSTEPGSTFECRRGTTLFAPCTSPFGTGGLADGSYTVEVRAIDAVGNADGSPDSRAFTIDTAPPDTTITAGPGGATNDSTPSFTLASTDTGSSFECQVDAGAFATCASPFTPAALADGAHTVQVRATDPAGNVDGTPVSRAFTVDTAPPDTTITSGPTSGNTPAFAFTSTETGATFECRVDTGAFATCTSPFTTPALTDGAHTVDVRAVDAAGNADASPASRAFTVAASLPDTTITAGPSDPTNDNTPTFTFSSPALGATFACRFGTAAFAPCTSPFTAATLADGAYVFEVQATDAQGNADPTPASRSVTVDTTAPKTKIDSGPVGSTDDDTPTFEFSSNDATATFQCKVDAAAFVPCESPFTLKSLDQGGHTFTVRSVDAAGNSAAGRSTRFKFAKLPPPVIFKKVNAEPVTGDVFVSLPKGTAHASQSTTTVPGIKGRTFVPLEEARQIPVGSFVDARRGTVDITAAGSTPKLPQKGNFRAGAFQLVQPRSAKVKGLTELRLKGASFADCLHKGIAPSEARAAGGKRDKVKRLLKASGKGHFRTRGKYSSATVRGTVWTVTDRCDGTLTTVERGVVDVRDFAKRKTISVRAGHTYLARATQ